MSQSAPRHPKHHKNHKAGFTLIEFMIVTTLGILLMLTASSVFLTMLVGRARTATLQRLKTEGDYAMGQMEFLLRNAVKLMPTTANPNVTCATGTDMNEVVLQSVDGGITQLTAQTNTLPDTNKIASISATRTTVLTSSAVDLLSGPTFRCFDNVSEGNRYFTITFTLGKNDLEQTFTSGVSMRNY